MADINHFFQDIVAHGLSPSTPWGPQPAATTPPPAGGAPTTPTTTTTTTPPPAGTPDPAGYDAWLRSYVTGYVGKFGQSDLSLADNSTDQASLDKMTKEIGELSSFRKIYNSGVTVDQMLNAPLQGHGNQAFDTGGFGLFGNKDYGDLTKQQQEMVDKGWFERVYNPTMGGGGSEGGTSGGYYWANTDKTPKVLGQYGTGQFAQFNPFNKSQWANANSFSFDPNYGLVTTAQNRSSDAFTTFGDKYMSTAIAAALSMGMGALVGGGAAAMAMKAPGMLQGIDNGGSPVAALLSMAAGASGIPGAGFAAQLGGQLMSGGRVNPIALLLALAQARGGTGGGSGSGGPPGGP